APGCRKGSPPAPGWFGLLNRLRAADGERSSLDRPRGEGQDTLYSRVARGRSLRVRSAATPHLNRRACTAIARLVAGVCLRGLSPGFVSGASGADATLRERSGTSRGLCTTICPAVARCAHPL